MSDGIEVTADGDTIVITTRVGDKVASVRVTHEYARRLAARLMVAATADSGPRRDASGRFVDA